jgi:hypothetical protein
MGSLQAAAFAEAVKDGDTNLSAALTYHLTANHYPPLPISLVPVAERVIELAQNEDWFAKVELPEGITYKGGTWALVTDCAQAWHLDAFILSAEDYYQDDDDDES